MFWDWIVLARPLVGWGNAGALQVSKGQTRHPLTSRPVFPMVACFKVMHSNLEGTVCNLKLILAKA